MARNPYHFSLVPAWVRLAPAQLAEIAELPQVTVLLIVLGPATAVTAQIGHGGRFFRLLIASTAVATAFTTSAAGTTSIHASAGVVAAKIGTSGTAWLFRCDGSRSAAGVAAVASIIRL